MVDFVKSLLGDFDPVAFLPDLYMMFEHMDTALRIVVLVGPLCLLGLGLLYLLAAPKEANHVFGYRHFWGMSSVEAWQFTQKTAGYVWTGLGLAMTVAMAFIANSYRDMAWEAMLFSAFTSVVVELLLVVVSTFLINALVILHFDRKGQRRGEQE
ncbi:MAG: SdpI family protein [Oscillospiraceae bacterium]|nr:SdpI family protein [Oscillospiraceae bacterium]